MGILVFYLGLIHLQPKHLFERISNYMRTKCVGTKGYGRVWSWREIISHVTKIFLKTSNNQEVIKQK